MQLCLQVVRRMHDESMSVDSSGSSNVIGQYSAGIISTAAIPADIKGILAIPEKPSSTIF